MSKKKENYRLKNIKSLIIIALGNLLLTSAYAFLTVPNNIINGGVTSTSLLLSHYLNIDIGYISSTITILLLVFGLIALGKNSFIAHYLVVFVIWYFLIFFMQRDFIFHFILLLSYYLQES